MASDTEMIRAGDEFGAVRALRSALPWPASRVYPAPEVAERLVLGVERRSSAVYAQQWVRGVRLARPWLPPLVALRSRWMMRNLERDGGIAATGPLGAGGEAAVDGRADGAP
ncbi:hypothetical protein ACFXDI_47580 [Streptomyces mirabilis]|uniref:hypothetical protein n=1 Tax=Streptomyces mirabilis TaxID=68239 RepID=UPI003684DAA0